MILLDTCALLWLCADQQKLSKKAKGEILKHASGLFVSSITAFEIAIKHKRKKLELPLEPQVWFDAALENYGIREIAVSSRIATVAVNLTDLHNDPCDRIIVATAQLHNLICLTPDTLIGQYPAVTTLW